MLKSLFRPIVLPILCLAASLASIRPALAHEFWVEPEKYQVETGGSLKAGLRNGEMFKGARLPYLDHRIRRFDISQGDVPLPYKGRMGDMPALVLEALEPGLLILLHETTPDLITYETWDAFSSFAQTKGLLDVESWSQGRAGPNAGFGEYYTRHTKSLIAVGSGIGSDRAFGLETEFVALQNPYELHLSAGETAAVLQFQLLYQGVARPQTQVELFARGPEDAVQRQIFKTDDSGVVQIPVQSGQRYLLNSVVLRPFVPTTETEAAVLWETLWASLVFAIP